MSNARELALLEKWTSSSDGATILPGLSSPTSPKATKFCCCPNRRRYTLKQPKLTTTLHVRNIFVDNDFNFIDDTTTENDDDDDEEDGENAENGQGDNNIEEILLYDRKNYKRAVSWPSARRTLKNSNRNHNNNQNNNNNNSKLTKPIEVSVEAPKENRSRIQVTATATATKSAASSANDYDDIVEVAAKNSAGGISASESTEKFKIAEAETNEWRRHDKSCHNNRNNCLTKNDEQQNERKSNNDYDDDRCSLEEESLRVQQEQQQQGNEQQQHLGHDHQSKPTKCGLRKSLTPLPIGNDEGRDVTSSTSSTSHSSCFNYSSTKNGEQCLGFSRLLASPKNLKANEQNAAIATTKTSPIIQRLSEIREIKDSLCKQTLSNTTATQQQQQHPEHCNNCQFCFNQSCRNFSQLQQSLQDIDNNSNTSKNRQPFSPIGNNQKMTITTNTSTNVANSFQEPGVVAVANPKQPTDIVSGLSLTAAMNNDMSSLPPATTRTQVPPSTLMLATSNNRPTSPNNTQLLSPTPASSHQQCNTPSSPLTTTVIKTTMVKRSPANESTTSPTAASASAATSPTSASLTLEKSLAFITTTSPFCNNVPHYPQQDAPSMATKENKPANTSNKCLSDAKGTLLPKVAVSSSTTPMSVKERIAALVAGNEQNQKQHDNNFINNRTSMKNQCNKTMRSTSLQQQSNMTYPQRHGQAATSVFNSSSNMCQQSLSPTTLRARKASLVADEVDSGPMDGNETNLLLTSKATNAGNEGEVVEDINDNLNRTNTTTTTTPTSSLSQTASSGMGRLSAKPSPSDDTHKPSHGSVTNNHMAYHNAAVNKYGSSGGAAATATATATSPSTSSSNSAMTVDSRTQQRSILSNTNRNQSLPTSSGSAATSSSNDTNGDNRLYDLTVSATPTTSPISNTSPQGDGDGNETEAATTSTSSRNKLEALANLDLALNLYNLPLDLDDDDDPYFVLQEYLERVKHEINEVFELHKARQKAQQQQHQEQQAVPPFESDTNTAGTSIENQIIDTLKAAVSNDELSRSTESDSGFDSATGGGRRGAGAGAASASTPQLDVGSNKLPSRAKVTTTSTDAKENDNKKASRPQEDNSDSGRRLMENATKTEMPLRDAKQQTSKEPKPPKHSTMIPNTEQGIQEQHLLEAVSTRTLPASLPCSSLASTSVSTVDTAAAVTAANISSAIAAAPSSSTLKRLRKQLQTKSPAEVATDDVNMWANKFLRDLDNLMASDKATNMTMMPTSTTTTTTTSSSTANSLLVASRNSISPGPTSPMLLSAAATAVIQSRYGKGAHDRYVVGPGSAAHDHHHQHQLSSGTGCGTTAATTSSTNGIVLRPEKHATIPLQSFNLDCRRLDNAGAQASAAGSGGNVTRTNVAYLRTLSAPTPSASQTIYHSLLHGNNDQLTSSSAGGKVISPKAQLGQRNSLAATGVGSYSLNASLDHHQNSNLTNFQSNDAAATSTDMSHGDIKSPMSSAAKLKPTTILKIEETSSKAVAGTVGAPSTLLQCSTPIAESAPTPTPTAADVESLHQKRLRQLNMEMDNLRNTSIDQSQQLSALMQQNHYCNGGGGGGGVGAGGQSSSNGNKHKTLMTTSSCAMPKKASTSNGTAATNATSSSMGSAATTMTCNRQQQQTPANVAATSYLLHGSDATKKGSTSTIWTSEESILRSVGAVDEDNNSTSSSACEEASGALSSGKSGISLDSSGVENDNNESGIGTATPPKDMSYWKSMPHHHHGHHHHHHHHNQQDNESVSSLEAMRKIQFQKGSSVTSSDDPDLLEVLSLCDETHNDGEEDGEGRANHNLSSLKPQNNEEEEEDMDDDYDMVDEEDEGHDEFEIATYCDCDCTEDGDASSASAGSSGNRTNSSSINNGSLSDSNGSGGVVLRRKYAASPIMVPQKCRSHSLDTSSLPNSYHQQQHQGQGLHGIAANGHHHMHVGQHAQLARKLQHLRDRQKDRNQLSLALRQEPFQSLLAPTHFHELPSPSSASLHSGHEILDTQELSTKSNSAPLLLKQEKRLDDFANQNVTLRYSRSQSDRYLADCAYWKGRQVQVQLMILRLFQCLFGIISAL
ncbi:probable serine/threonine-protein kinase DDB_G0282963 isoform X1 [Stomoxys calcitrans]|uniref:probable serine/threonine-protein kinase DDB_G0282963 isoform X1 n=1 Tax=Stomoxys calcitrans TaxID=35570 RepID=UPI0027E2A69E|nr:probable serine/threonine-protein kinase DDB_G0282963 isoform X1 [Stomoxys calcitrans]